MALTAQQIYEFFHKQSTGTSALEAAQAAAQRLSGTYEDRSFGTQQLINDLSAGWQGHAQEAAAQGLAPFAESSYQTGSDLGSTQRSASAQIDAFHATAAKVTPMPAQPAMQDPLAAMMNGQTAPTMAEQVTTYNTTAHANIAAYQSFQATTTTNTHAMPDVSAQMDTQSAPVAIAPATTTTTGASAKGAMYRPSHTTTSTSGATASPASGTTSRSVATPTGPAITPGPAAPTPTSQPPGGTTSTSGFTPPSTQTVTSPGTGPGLPGGVPTGTGPASGGQPTTYTGSGYLTGTPAGGLPDEFDPLTGGGTGNITSRLTGGDTGARTGTTAGLPGEGERATGLRTGAGAGAGAGGAVEEDGPGTRGGVGANTAALEEEALANPRGVTTTGGMGGPMAAGRGKRGEDSEHDRKYVRDEAHEDLFDAGPVIQPVLGETPEQRRRREHDQ